MSFSILKAFGMEPYIWPICLAASPERYLGYNPACFIRRRPLPKLAGTDLDKLMNVNRPM